MPITQKKISFNLNLEDELESIKPSKRKEVTELVALSVIDNIQEHLSRGVSPVSKGEYKKTLSKEYAKKKGKKVSDLYDKGDMLGNLSFTNTKKDITLKITDSTEKKKAYNHNVGDTLPTRKFLPDDSSDEVFKRSIMASVKEIIRNASQD